MIQKLTKATTRLLAILFAMFATTGAWAATDKTNPVTGENQSYTYNYTGSGAWTASDWSPTPSNVPQASGSGVWDSLLIDGNLTVTAPSHVEGWSFRIGLFGGAKLTVPYIRYWNGTAYAVVDEGSKLTIKTINTQDNWNATVNYYVAAAGGVTYECAFNPTVTAAAIYNYNLKGAGSVVYENAVSSGSHVIKQADVTLSGTSEVVPKPLVSFTSSSTTFTADAAIKVYGTDGTTLVETVNLAEVKAAATLTTSDPVGSCEIVQTSTGIVLYYVDGDPSAVVAKTYTPSININFTNGASNGLTTQADVGLSGYEVPGTSWNNYVVANSTFSTVNAVDSTGAASAMSGVSVTISGTRGSYSCGNLTPSSNPLHGYIDENGNNPTPTVTVTGIPYYKYRVLVYHSTDSGSVQFGYDTINGKNYTYVNDALSEGTTAWGDSGAQDSANAISEGGNVLVTEALSGSALTVVGHRAGGNSSARGCIAAIQIIEVKADVGENDLEIPVSGDTQYTVEETKELSGTVYLTGLGTLTLAGENKISAATIEISEGVTLVVNADRLDATTFTGAGTVVYDGSQPATTKGFDNSAWTGTVWVKNVGDTSKGEATGDAYKVTTCLGSSSGTAEQNILNNWGNASSFVKFTNVRGYMSTASVPWTLVLEDDGDTKAWYNNNGWTDRSITIATLKGDGSIWDINDGGCRPFLNFGDASQFTGTIKVLGKQVFLNDTSNTGSGTSLSAGRITVPANQTLTVASGKTWHTRNGLVVNGTLNVNGTLASDSTTAAVSGSGTAVFTGRAPTPTGDAWWKNADWTGTVQVKDVTNMVGDSRAGVWLKFNDYGNSGSVVEMNNVTGWLETGYTCTVPLKVTGSLYLNNGGSGKASAFKVGTLLGSGTISGDGSAPTVVFNITDDWSGFTGTIGLNNKCIVFGETIPDELTAGTIYVSEGAVVTPQQSSGVWWAVGGIKVDGELRAPNLGKFGGGTNITTSDNGVFTLTSTGNGTEGETDTDYARIKGTGSLKYAGTGWRALTTNKLSTAVTLVNEQAGDILLSRALTYNIGSLSGSKKFQGNYGSGKRYLNIVQTKDTEWSGTIATDNSSRLAGFSLDATSTGTLTLSGVETQTATLAVNGGSVNLTGTWKGATTVAGTFGGTGTLTGNLTFNAGSTFKAFASDENGLAVSGTVTCPAEGTVTVDVSALEQTGTKVLMTASGLDVSKFALASGQSGTLSVAEGALKVSFTTYVAEYGGIQYETVQEAINAAVADSHTYEDVRILDATATCPAGYYIDTEDNDALKMYQAAIVQNNEGAMTTNFFKTAQLAVNAIEANFMTYGYYSHFEVYSGTVVEMEINPAAMMWSAGASVKVKCLNGATVAVAIDSTEYELTAGTADENGIVTYTKTDKATTYVWAGATSGSATTAEKNYARADNWKVGTSSGATAARAPGSLDTVVFESGAYASNPKSQSVAALQVSGTVTIVGGGTLTSASAITLGESDSIKITGTLSPAPTTNVAHYRVKTVTSGDTTTYSVEAIPGTTFTVY